MKKRLLKQEQPGFWTLKNADCLLRSLPNSGKAESQHLPPWLPKALAVLHLRLDEDPNCRNAKKSPIFLQRVRRIISYHIISYHFISYHFISYHFISCHIISYHLHISSTKKQRELEAALPGNCYRHHWHLHGPRAWKAPRPSHEVHQIFKRGVTVSDNPPGQTKVRSMGMTSSYGCFRK